MDLVEKCCQVVQLAIDDAQRKADANGEQLNINRFVLIGESSDVPMICRALKREFHEKYAQGRAEKEWIQLIEPEEAVAKGAAIYAHHIEQGKVLFGEKFKYAGVLDEKFLKDVTISPITPEVENQIKRTMALMDQDEDDIIACVE